MAEATEPKLIPKGAKAVPAGPQQNDRTAIVNDSANAEVQSARNANQEIKNLREKLTAQVQQNHDLKRRNTDLEKVSQGALQLQKELDEVRGALNAFSDDESGEKLNRRSRRFQLFVMLLQGAAVKGELFGNQVNEASMKKVVRHYAGVAQVAEEQALSKGF